MHNSARKMKVELDGANQVRAQSVGFHSELP